MKNNDTIQADKKENRAAVVRVRAELLKADEYLRWSDHLAIAHGQLYGKPYESSLNEVLKGDLNKFKKTMDARLKQVQLEEKQQ